MKKMEMCMKNDDLFNSIKGDQKTKIEKMITIYLSTIYTEDAPAVLGTTNTFSKVKNDYCKDLDKLEHLLDIIFYDEREYYKNFSRIKITGGELGDLDKDYITKLYKILEKYNNITVYKNIDNAKFSVHTNGRLFDRISYEEIEKYKVNTVKIFTMNSYKPGFYTSKVDDNFVTYNNQNLYDANKMKRFISYAFILNDLSDEFFYDKFRNGDFINVWMMPYIKSNPKFAECGYTLETSKFYPAIVNIDNIFNTKDCSKYSYRFGIDLVNDTIVKCDFGYDDSPRIKLTDENLKTLLEYNVENFIPNFDTDVCSNCTHYKCEYKVLSFDFKNSN